MLYFPLWKKLLAASVLLFAVLQAVPNTLSPEQRSNLPAFMQKTINLGLDLQGGSHLVLEVDVEAVVVRAYQNLEDEVREVLRRNKVDNERVNYQDLRAVGAQRVSFNAFNEGQRAGLLKLLEKEIRNVLVEINETSGDVSLVFTPEYLEETRLFALNQTLEILRSRVDEFGVAEPLIQRQGERRVIIQLPGIDDVERAKNIIGRTAQLTFHLVEEGSTLSARKPGTAVYYEEYTDPVSGQINRIPYVLQVRPILTGEHLSRASSGFTQDTGEAAVFLTFDATGTRKFAKATTEHTGRRMAIVLDGQVYSAPSLREPILGGQAQISGSFNAQEAEDLATVLRAGALPAPVTFAEERTVGPSLGQDSVAAGQMAIVLGFVLVLVLMIVFYGWFGVVANVALLFNVALIAAVMTFLGATLTLPGMAGIVLTIGMAVDANVLIFERIREEFNEGRSVRMAVDMGFKSAFHTILDANITTMIAAVVLFAMGSGPIKGFALTLSVGIASSMFTAIMVSRLLIVQWLALRKPKKLPL